MWRLYLFLGCSFVFAMSLVQIAADVAMVIAILTFVIAMGHMYRIYRKGPTNVSHPNRKTSRNNFFRRDDL